MQRRRFKNVLSFPDRLDQEAERLRTEAENDPTEQSATRFYAKPGKQKRLLI